MTRNLSLSLLFGVTIALTAPAGVFVSAAYAHGGGGGGGGGNGGDHGGGHADGIGSGVAADRADTGSHTGINGHGATGHAAHGHAAHGQVARSSSGRIHGQTVARASNRANDLGKLNAAHASPTARAHAAPNSAVGNVAAYSRALNQAQAIPDPAARQAAIAKAIAGLNSNKPVTPGVVDQVDARLGQ